MYLLKYILPFLLSINPAFIDASDPPEKMNVLFIITDDLNCAIGAYGDPLVHTPNIDKLAEKGVVFPHLHQSYPS